MIKIKQNNIFFVSIFFVLSVILTTFIFFQVTNSSFFFRQSLEENQLIDRAVYEEQIQFPFEPTSDLLESHFKIIMPTLGLVIFVALMMLIFSLTIFSNIILHLLVSFMLALWVATFFISPLQFIILLLPILSSYIIVTVFFERDCIIEKINTIFLILCAQVIIVTEVLSLLKCINAFGFVTLFSLIMIILFMRYRISSYMIQADIESLLVLKGKFLDFVQNNRMLGVLFSFLLISILWRMMLINVWPPNNSDSMHYHLSRVAYWVQHQSLDTYFSYNMRQVTFPFNGEILFLWTMVASELDYLSSYIQMACYIMSGSLLYQCIRQYLKNGILSSLTVTFIWYSIPIVVLQSTTTQNDLILAYFMMYGFVNFLCKDLSKFKEIFLISIAFACGIGTKTIGIMFLLPCLIVVGIYVIRKKTAYQILLKWIAILFAMILTLGSYCYIQNFYHFQNIFGPKHFVKGYQVGSISFSNFISTFSQYVYDIVTNQTGLHIYISVLSNQYNDWVAQAGIQLFQWLHIPLNTSLFRERLPFYFDSWVHKFKCHEDYAYFGFIGFLMMVLILLVFVYCGISIIVKKSKDYNRYLVFAISSMGFLIVYSLVGRWHYWAGRHMIVMFLVGMPLFAIILDSQNKNLQYLGNFILILSLIMLLPTTFMNELKPLNPYYADREGFRTNPSYPVQFFGGIRELTYNNDRIGRQYLHRPYEEMIYRKFNNKVPINSKVGILVGMWHWDYPYFGRQLKRTVVPIKPDMIERKEIIYLIIDKTLLEKRVNLKNLIERLYQPTQYLGHSRKKGDFWLYMPNELID